MQALYLLPDRSSLQSLQLPPPTDESTMSAASKKLLAQLKKLTSFSCEDGPLTDADIAALPWLNHLHTLDLKGFTNIDPILMSLKPDAALQNLTLSNCGLTDKGFARITTLPSLRKLIFGGAMLTGNEIVPLIASPALEVLDLTKTVCKFDPTFIDALGRFKKLKTLKLGMLTQQQAQQLQALKDKGITLDYVIK